jgi:dienelactone hydrolase
MGLMAQIELEMLVIVGFCVGARLIHRLTRESGAAANYHHAHYPRCVGVHTATTIGDAGSGDGFCE